MEIRAQKKQVFYFPVLSPTKEISPWKLIIMKLDIGKFKVF